MPRGGPCAAERRPHAAERSPLCRREEAPVPRGGLLCRRVFCAESIGGGPVSGGGSCAERRPSVLVGPVVCAERIEGGHCVGRRLTEPNGSTPLCCRD